MELRNRSGDPRLRGVMIRRKFLQSFRFFLRLQLGDSPVSLISHTRPSTQGGYCFLYWRGYTSPSSYPFGAGKSFFRKVRSAGTAKHRLRLSAAKMGIPDGSLRFSCRLLVLPSPCIRPLESVEILPALYKRIRKRDKREWIKKQIVQPKNF